VDVARAAQALAPRVALLFKKNRNRKNSLIRHSLFAFMVSSSIKLVASAASGESDT
jgi:hypothetical protein